MNYTKGEWAIGLETDEERAQVIAQDGSHICYVECDPVMANANLIAAAPQTTESLNTILSALPAHWTDAQAARRLNITVEQLRSAKQALAKAGGKC